MAKLTALQTINHDGRDYAEGDTLTVTNPAQIAQLVDAGAAVVAGSKTKTVQAQEAAALAAMEADAVQAAEVAAKEALAAESATASAGQEQQSAA